MEEEQAAEDRYWKIPICYDDDEDYTIAITPVLPTKEPVNSLSMGDEHLDTILATESDEVIKSSVENLVPIPSESRGKIDYVDASPPNDEIVSLEVVEIVSRQLEDDTNSSNKSKNVLLREKLLNVNLLIANIEALKDNPAPSSDVMIKSSSTFLNLFLEETNTFDNSLIESFCFDLEEISSGSTTTHSDYSLPDYEAFYDNHIEEKSSGSTTTHADFSQYDIHSSLIFRSIHFLLPIGVIFIMRSSPMNLLTSYLHRSMIISALRLSPSWAILLWMRWRIFSQQENQEFMCLIVFAPRSSHPSRMI
ncbi:hypothetical protein Tco_1209452 [Tanacetum coccineum]